MYVKVPSINDQGDFITQAAGPINSGTVLLDFGPNDTEVLDQLNEAIDANVSYLHVLQVGIGERPPLGPVSVRYATWYDPTEGQVEGVVTSRHIFIVGENGKTIDRVR
jgi:hypothetical protein